MIKYLPYKEEYQNGMYEVFQKLTQEEVFYKEMTFDEFSSSLFKSRSFQAEGTFVALDEDKVVGFAGLSTCLDEATLNNIVVKKSSGVIANSKSPV